MRCAGRDHACRRWWLQILLRSYSHLYFYYPRANIRDGRRQRRNLTLRPPLPKRNKCVSCSYLQYKRNFTEHGLWARNDRRQELRRSRRRPIDRATQCLEKEVE
ncbi:Putative uncharacterized protein [Bifidobacterium animalis subsp. animalis IM386]|uniref:Secreted protein n=1 Tax=Bifidobacterium animalis subsp. animalis IM386 TaxID=1402194 RepID=A0AAV2W0Q8_9BIFI|nr:Putative uncharacterized protein [Bifidobacterium animalis subsp. animalis IM386]